MSEMWTFTLTTSSFLNPAASRIAWRFLRESSVWAPTDSGVGPPFGSMATQPDVKSILPATRAWT